jgi:hypothetical protein
MAAAPTAPGEPTAMAPGVTTGFLSADELQYEEVYIEKEEEEAAAPAAEIAAEDGPVRDGDIYRVLADGTLVYLNPFRGLQLIDTSDLAQPRFIGRLRLIGEPIDMHVTEDYAVALMLQRDRATRVGTGPRLSHDSGGVIFLIDVSDRAAPRILSETRLSGYPRSSRLAERDGQVVLYTVSEELREFESSAGVVESVPVIVAESFQIAAGSLSEHARLEIVGLIGSVRTQPDVLLIERDGGFWYPQPSEITLIDISAADGSLIERATVTAAGDVISHLHMDLHGGKLRVFSRRLGSAEENHLQIWDAGNLDAPVLVDGEGFAPGEDLQGAILLADRAFAATYDVAVRRESVFHTFAIGDVGDVRHVMEADDDGRNHMFLPTLGGTRLLGIGIDDSNSQRVTASLYDITDLANPVPRLARLAVRGPGPGNDHSIALEDPRAATVLENAVNEPAPTGETETGLLLLPFQSWWTQGSKIHYLSGVQIFSFSETTLTRRGIMDAPSTALRTIAARGLVNIGLRELGLFDRGALDEPVETGRLGLAPIYDRIVSFGDFRVRLETHISQLSAEVQVISSAAPADVAEPLASFLLPGLSDNYFGRDIFRVGESLLVTMASRSVGTGRTTTITTHDPSNPLAPRRLGQLVTSTLPSPLPWEASSGPQATVRVVGNTLIFLRMLGEEAAGDYGTVCRHTIWTNIDCAGEVGCTYPAGEQTCYDFGADTQFCDGGFALCTDLGDGQSQCLPRDAEDLPVPVEIWCTEKVEYRRWWHLDVRGVDLSNPAAPTLIEPIVMPIEHEFLSAFVDGSSFYVSTKVPTSVPGDPRSYARYFLTRIDFSRPGQPVIGAAINVPGEVFAVQGSTLLARDKVWGKQFVETAIAQIRLLGNRALVQRYRRFTNRVVREVAADDGSMVAVKHGQVWRRPWGTALGAFDDTLTLLRAEAGAPVGALPGDFAVLPGDFAVLSQSAVAVGPTLGGLAAGRLFLDVIAGLQVIDIVNPKAPVARAFFPHVRPLARALVEQGELVFAGGALGILQFDLDTENLPGAAP